MTAVAVERSPARRGRRFLSASDRPADAVADATCAARRGPTEAQPLRFVQVPEAALTLPPRQLVTLTAVLRFCWRSPLCRAGQRTLGHVIGKSPGYVNQGLRELGAAGIVRKIYQRTRKGLECGYAVAPGYWVTPKNPSISATCSQVRTESYSTLNRIILNLFKESPRKPLAREGRRAPY